MGKKTNIMSRHASEPWRNENITVGKVNKISRQADK